MTGELKLSIVGEIISSATKLSGVGSIGLVTAADARETDKAEEVCAGVTVVANPVSLLLVRISSTLIFSCACKAAQAERNLLSHVTIAEFLEAASIKAKLE